MSTVRRTVLLIVWPAFLATAAYWIGASEADQKTAWLEGYDEGHRTCHEEFGKLPIRELLK